jgi:alanine dehydrogenase
VDDFTQAWHSGEVNVSASQGKLKPEDVYAEMGEIIAGKKAGRVSEVEVTIFDSTGLAIQDVATANFLYRQALKKNLGQRVKLLV